MMFSSSSTSTSAGPSRLPNPFSILKKESHIKGPSYVETTVPHVALPARPPATYAAYHEPHTAPNALDNFFGANTLEASPTRTSMPPPYAPYGHKVVEVEQGVYSVKEPATLARMLFFYGFLFFPFWLAGICVLFSPLLPTPDWESGKTEDEKVQLLQILRETEKKWARRCLYAILGLAATILLLVVIIKYGILANI